MSFSNYELTPDQMDALDEIADVFIDEIEELATDIGGILDPYDTPDGAKDYSKLNEMVLYIGHYISACSYESA